MLADFEYTVGLSNGHAQYWAPVDSKTTRFDDTGIIPGEYTLTIYKNELPVYVAPSKISIVAGSIMNLKTITIHGDPQKTPALWRIGIWDGTPLELLNGHLLTAMHPSDKRLTTWVQSEPYVVGIASRADQFPAYQWKDVNGRLSIQFQLPEVPSGQLTLRIGTTTEFNSAVPQVMLNKSWISPAPANRPVNGSRNLTVGTNRGVNRLYTIDLPNSVLRVGTNQIELSVLSNLQGSLFQSHATSYDAIDLVQKP